MTAILGAAVRAGLMAAAGALSARYGITVDADAIEAIAAGLCAAAAVGMEVRQARKARP